MYRKRGVNPEVHGPIGRRRSWDQVYPPLGWSWNLPFTIYQRGFEFSVGSFSLRERANISVAKTYYLNTVSGNDAWDGLTPTTPNLTWNHIIGHGDYDRIVIQDGSYLTRPNSTLQPNRSCEIIGEGTVHFTSDRSANVGAWALVGGRTYTYQAAIAGGAYIASVLDHGTLDSYGKPYFYTSKSNINDVEATAGSFYWVGGTLYCHTLNGLTPTGQTDIIYYDSVAMNIQRDNMTFYFENIHWDLSCIFYNNSAAGGTKIYMKNCHAYGITVGGIDEIVFQNLIVLPKEDGINYSDRNGLRTNFIEIDCESYDGGIDGTHQASTSHLNSRGVRINGSYHHMTGQCVADVDNAEIWMLGCDMFNSSIANIGYYTAHLAYLDTCQIANVTTAISIAGGSCYIRNLTSNGVFIGTPILY